MSNLSDPRPSWIRLPTLRLALYGFLVLPSACANRASPPVAPEALGRGAPVHHPPQTTLSEAVRRRPPNPQGEISLQDAIALALQHSPALEGFAWEVRAQEARAVQLGRWPNPELGVLVEDIGAPHTLSSAPNSEQPVQPQTTIQLSQLVELGGRRSARRAEALLGRDVAAWDYEIARTDVFTATTQAFIALLVAQERVTLMRQNAGLVGRVTESVAARVEAGMVSPIELTRAEAAQALADLEAVRAENLLTAARSRLAAAWGGREATFGTGIGNLRTLGEVPALPDLLERLTTAPELLRWNTVIAQRQRSLALARAARIPAVTLTAGVRRFPNVGGSALLLGASLALPVFDLNGAGVQEAESRGAQARTQRDAATALAFAALVQTYLGLATARQELTALSTVILPRAEEAFSAMTEGYQLGRFDYLAVLDAQRTLIDARSHYLRALSDFHTSWSEVERQLGAPLVPVAAPAAPRGQE